MPDDLLATLVGLETALHRPDVRHDAAQLERLLHDDFLEFGRSGRSYSKADMLAHLLSESDAPPPRASGFALKRLGAQVGLLTYRTVRTYIDGSPATHSLRSSLWQWRDGRWQMVFHQGTPTRASDED